MPASEKFFCDRVTSNLPTDERKIFLVLYPQYIRT